MSDGSSGRDIDPQAVGEEGEKVEGSAGQQTAAESPSGSEQAAGGGIGESAASGVTIAWKITSVITVVLTLLAVFNIVFIRDRFNTTMEAEYRSKADAIALSLAGSAEDKLVSGNVGAIQTLVDGYREIRGVRYVYVSDDRGKVVAHTFDSGFPEPLEGVNPVTGEEEFTAVEIDNPAVGKVMEVGVPILFGVAGSAHVGMDRGLIALELRKITTRLIVQFSIAFILAVGLLHLMVKYLLRHLGTVMDVLTRAGKGDLTARVDVSTRDEFRVLADQLNATLHRLGGMISGVRVSYDSIAVAKGSITRVYKEVLQGTEQQAGLADESMDSVTQNKRMVEEVTEGIHVLGNSANDSFSSIMEMGASIEEVSSMSDSLFRSVNESNQAIETMSSSISEISDNLLSLSKSTEETASAMSEMGVSIQQVRANTESTSEDAVKMTQVAEEGSRISRTAMEGTLAIRDSSAQVGQLISLVTDRIEEIDEILSFIPDITGRTNLLALNAAIIAAQAGAQGKGFGVVADEINDLAQNTKAQTNRIASVIQGIREEVTRTGEAVQVASGNIEEGVRLTEQVTKALENILDSTQQVSHRVEEIARTASEQASTSQRVMETTESLSLSVNNIKEAVQSQSESGERLLEMSRRIQQVAQKVKTSTEEQTLTSQQINTDLTRITDTVKEIGGATDVQLTSGNKVFRMTEDLNRIIESNRRAVHGLQQVISDLNERTDTLEAELKMFKVEEG